jgi:hypothetical protein
MGFSTAKYALGHRAALDSQAAWSVLRAAVPDLDRRESLGQIEIADAEQWYRAGEKVEPRNLLAALLERERRGRSMPVTPGSGQTGIAQVTPEQWSDFQGYEALVQSAISPRPCECCAAPFLVNHVPAVLRHVVVNMEGAFGALLSCLSFDVCYLNQIRALKISESLGSRNFCSTMELIANIPAALAALQL